MSICAECGNELPKGTVPAELPPSSCAGFWKRFLASLIDGMVLLSSGWTAGIVIGFTLGGLLGGKGVAISAMDTMAGWFGYLIGLALNWLYFTLLESSPKQATLGKMALRIVVTDLNGGRISFGRANGRYWGKIPSAIIFLIGFIMAGFTRKKQGLHDLMAGTLVING
ncbi:MAG: RDD family protein [Firmicutes bacterium]|nr:RDD family protein [Bacillota bacterium]